jgi:hypothetical protein
MATIICPNCGYEQSGGAKCEKCSSLFEYYQGGAIDDHSPAPPSYSPTAAPGSYSPASQAYHESPKVAPSLFRRIYRVVSWASLVLLVIAIILIFHKSPAPKVPVDPQAAQRAESKLEASESAAASGQPQPLRLDNTEINSYLHQNLAVQPSDAASPAAATTSAPATPAPTQSAPAAASPDPTLEQVQSSVKDVQVTMHDDKVEAYVVFNFHGQDLSLNLEGRLNVANGYLQFEPTGGKLGSLPIPQSTLESALQQMLSSPENREKLKVPANINNLRIENGQLVVDYK